MVEAGQIRKFKDSSYPNIRIGFKKLEPRIWLCVFQEDVKYPYISLDEEDIENDTVLVEK